MRSLHHALPPERSSGVALISEYLANRGDLDVSAYAHSSLVRRLRARREAAGVHDWDLYRERLDADPDEYAELLRSIPVHRTSLFRDPACWSELAAILTRTLEERPRPTLTIWSAGCATGEEAYSVAATALDVCTSLSTPTRLRVIATDVSPSVLVTGRLGRIPSRGVGPIPHRAQRYFREEDDQVIVSNDLRQRIVFRHHDLLKDAPIRDVDVIVCRNTLMYFSIAAQRRVLAGFASALPDDGLLFTGLAELPSVWTGTFEPEQLGARIWRKAPRSEQGSLSDDSDR